MSHLPDTLLGLDLEEELLLALLVAARHALSHGPFPSPAIKQNWEKLEASPVSHLWDKGGVLTAPHHSPQPPRTGKQTTCACFCWCLHSSVFVARETSQRSNTQKREFAPKRKKSDNFYKEKGINSVCSNYCPCT